MSAQTQTDTIPLVPLPSLSSGGITSFYGKGNGPDTLLSLRSFIHTYREYLDASSNDYLFYENLRKAAQNSYITRWLHEFLVKKKAASRLQVTQPRVSQSEYEAYKGLTIREIKFSSADLFAPTIDNPNYYSPGRLEKIGMFLHFKTRESIIRNNLLFRQGESIDPFLLSDNERILRQLPYLEDARIYVVEDKLRPGYADIVVLTKDRWSKGFDMDISEIDEGRIELYDRNILGLGQELQGSLHFDGSEGNIFGYGTALKINNIGGNFISSEVSYSDAFGNNIFRFGSGRNFLTPSMKYAGGIELTSSALTDDFIFPDTSFINQRINYNEYDYWFGRSFTVPGKDSFNRRNIYITSRFNRYIFFERPEIDEKTRYIFHNRNLWLVNLTFVRMGYLKSNYIYGFGPTEDIPSGTRFEATAGYENNQFFPRWYTGVSLTQSNFLKNKIYLSSTVSFGGFLNDGATEQGVLKLQTSGFTGVINLNRFYLRQFFTLNYIKGINRFDDELVSISNHYGIRGLRSDKLQGNQKLTLQLETLLYAKKNWYGFRYALYAMADLGWIGRDGIPVLKESFYSGLGLGMRVRNENLVFPTLQFRFAWFPRIPDEASSRIFYIMSERRNAFDEFRVRAPEILQYR